MGSPSAELKDLQNPVYMGRQFFFPKEEGLVSSTLCSVHSEFSQMNHLDPACTGINGKKVTCLAEALLPKLGTVCRGTWGQHTVKRNPEYFITLQALLEAWHEVGFVFQCGLTPCSAPHPNGHPRPLHRAIKPHRKYTPSHATSTLDYTSTIIWSFQPLCFPHILHGSTCSQLKALP